MINPLIDKMNPVLDLKFILFTFHFKGLGQKKLFKKYESIPLNKLMTMNSRGSLDEIS